MALSYSTVKAYKPVRGVRGGIVDITLDDSYDNGGWSIAYSALTNYLALGARIYNLVPPASKNGYRFEAVPVSGNASVKLKALLPSVSETFIQAAIAEFTQYPAYTATEQAAAYAVCYCKTEDDYCLLSKTNTDLGDSYAAEYQLFPDADTDAIGDAVFFGYSVPFAQIGFDMSATVAVWAGAGSVGWSYWDGSAWSDLDASIINDGSGSTATDGTYPFEQDGVLTFVPPQDWAATTVNGQSAYWIKCELLVAAVTTPGLTNSTEHDINVPDTGIVFTYNGTVTSVTINDTSDTLHTANDIEFVFINTTTGDSSGVIAFPQDMALATVPLPYPVDVSIGDKCAIVCTQEDGTNEFDSGTFTYNLSNAEALADDANLDGLVLRCEVIGT
jgi:hypothetical protein